MEPAEKPEINKYTSIDVVVNLSHGIVMASSKEIIDECKKYGKKVYIAKKDTPVSQFADGKSMIDLISLAATQGAELHVFVEGDGAQAKNFALRLYSALTSEDSYDMDFGRFAVDGSR